MSFATLQPWRLPSISVDDWQDSLSLVVRAALPCRQRQQGSRLQRPRQEWYLVSSRTATSSPLASATRVTGASSAMIRCVYPIPCLLHPSIGDLACQVLMGYRHHRTDARLVMAGPTSAINCRPCNPAEQGGRATGCAAAQQHRGEAQQAARRFRPGGATAAEAASGRQPDSAAGLAADGAGHSSPKAVSGGARPRPAPGSRTRPAAPPVCGRRARRGERQQHR